MTAFLQNQTQNRSKKILGNTGDKKVVNILEILIVITTASSITLLPLLLVGLILLKLPLNI